MATKGKILTLKQVAEYLKVHKNTVYRLVNRKELPAFKVWHDWRFDQDSIDRWRLAQEQAANRPCNGISSGPAIEARPLGDFE
jgi:excisionase family DNA binding protein